LRELLPSLRALLARLLYLLATLCALRRRQAAKFTVLLAAKRTLGAHLLPVVQLKLPLRLAVLLSLQVWLSLYGRRQVPLLCGPFLTELVLLQVRVDHGRRSRLRRDPLLRDMRRGHA